MCDNVGGKGEGGRRQLEGVIIDVIWAVTVLWPVSSYLQLNGMNTPKTSVIYITFTRIR